MDQTNNDHLPASYELCFERFTYQNRINGRRKKMSTIRTRRRMESSAGLRRSSSSSSKHSPHHLSLSLSLRERRETDVVGDDFIVAWWKKKNGPPPKGGKVGLVCLGSIDRPKSVRGACVWRSQPQSNTPTADKNPRSCPPGWGPTNFTRA